MARPPKEINWDIVEKRMEAGNNAKTICEIFHIDTDTFYRRFKKEYGCSFGDYSALYYSTGNENIQYTQYMKALSGNVQMLIWLGKVRLSQREPELLTSMPVNQPEIDKDQIIMQLEHKIAVLENFGDK